MNAPHLIGIKFLLVVSRLPIWIVHWRHQNHPTMLWTNPDILHAIYKTGVNPFVYDNVIMIGNSENDRTIPNIKKIYEIWFSLRMEIIATIHFRRAGGNMQRVSQ